MLQRIDADRMPAHIRLVHSEDPATQDPVAAVRLKAWAARQKATREQAESEQRRFERRSLWAVAAIYGAILAGVIGAAFFFHG